MRTAITALVTAGVLLLSAGAASSAEPEPTGERPFMGVLIDKLQKQMRELRQRLEEQEERYRERLEKLEKYYDRLSQNLE